MPFPTTPPPLAQALTERAYDRPTPVQIAVLADEAIDRDLLVSAQTGSGKTVAYGLAIAKTLLGGVDQSMELAALESTVGFAELSKGMRSDLRAALRLYREWQVEPKKRRKVQEEASTDAGAMAA